MAWAAIDNDAMTPATAPVDAGRVSQVREVVGCWWRLSWCPPVTSWRWFDLPWEPGDLPAARSGASRPQGSAGCGSGRPDPHLDVTAAQAP